MRSSPPIRYRGDNAPDLWCLLSPPPSWTSPAAQVPPVSQERGEFGALVQEEKEEEKEEEVTGSRAELLIEREEASSLHFCCSCVRCRRDVHSEFTPLSRHHHPGACLMLTNGSVRKAERRRPRGRLHVSLITQTFLTTVMHQS